ncbi:hypothetical protein VKT23_009467 [Stygiomarasmius scandens]|uniref:DDE Tnp4 domain-containing protein n=1 Tax=Marasmiellus scandens TaxID=2682957 RepID=A0ABR1JDU4_9AGAR
MDDNDALLLLLLLSDETSFSENERASRAIFLTAATLGYGASDGYGASEARRLRAERRAYTCLYLTRPQLLPNPRQDTPWQVLYGSQNDRAFITTTGFNVEGFNMILHSGFEDLWELNPIPWTDVPSTANPRAYHRSLDAAGALGLALHYLNSTVLETSLAEIFALIPSTVDRYISFSLTILLVTLRRMPYSQISWPQGDEFVEHESLILARHPLLIGAFGTVDGLKLPVQVSYTDDEVENATYNGWLHDHFISNVLAFAPTGVIIACRLNAPGSWHDSRVARPIYSKLLYSTPDGYYLAADTAFPRGTDSISGKIRAPVKDGTQLPSNVQDRQQLLAFDNQLLSFRQAAEWGMCTMQGSFGRLRVPMKINDDEKRGDLLEICTHLFNLRARTVGHNQIRSVYLPIWQASDQERVWNDFENIVYGEQRRSDRVRRFYLTEGVM